ncbi:hypothetical protein Syun_019083 [Stephania yunnanensis]|uniref:Uncharacterized protein n=1 Tax=Stephania yunnanensis TaxID=152371 RepID=A0AAP0NZ26_9MAGN
MGDNTGTAPEEHPKAAGARKECCWTCKTNEWQTRGAGREEARTENLGVVANGRQPRGCWWREKKISRGVRRYGNVPSAHLEDY